MAFTIFRDAQTRSRTDRLENTMPLAPKVFGGWWHTSSFSGRGRY